jgi:hypothetical protein
MEMCSLSRWVRLARPHVFRKKMHRIVVIHFWTEGTEGTHAYVMLKASTYSAPTPEAQLDKVQQVRLFRY